MALIELQGIRKEYVMGETTVAALAGVDLRIEKGEFVALIGPSGSGKSTLMNTLGCLDRPTSGTYWLAGDEVSQLSRDELARIRNRRIGFVFQSYNLLPRTTAQENVELPLVYSGGMSAKERHTRAREMLERVGLGDRLDHEPAKLSGGQQQRVAVARALVNRPAILMGDEPTGNLDSKTSRDIIRLFRELNQSEGITVVLVTHDLEVAKHADRIIVLRDGVVVCDTREFEAAEKALRQEAIPTSEVLTT